MVGANLKQESLKLMESRSTVEAEMNIIIDRLCRPGGPGLSGNLLDSEGFPRSDIDIPTVRADRHKLAVLRNDHKDITEKINQNIELLHSARLEPTTSIKDSVENTQEGSVGSSLLSINPIAGGAFGSMDLDVVVSRPFAMIDEIAEESPAAEDGLQLGDQIVKFGIVDIGENLSQRLAAEAQKNVGQAVSVLVLRQGAPVNVTITPRAWSGRGLLGCHFRML